MTMKIQSFFYREQSLVSSRLVEHQFVVRVVLLLQQIGHGSSSRISRRFSQTISREE